MGNKATQLENGRVIINSDGTQILSYMSQSHGYFGIQGTWRPVAILVVLESLYHIPCLCECILAADIDKNCPKADRNAIFELKQLFEARTKITNNVVVPADKFQVSLTASQLEGHTNDFDQDDPGQVYDAISSLIITGLPELRGIFVRDKLLKDLSPTSKHAAGICINIPHKPDATLILETVIREKFLSKTKISHTAPVFVLTTAYATPCGTTKSSVLFPPVLSMSVTQENSSNAFMYNLQSVIVQSESDPTQVKSFYLAGNSSGHWYECGMSREPVSTLDILNLGSPESPFRTRVLIYIQMDLSVKVSTGFKFNTNDYNEVIALSNDKKRSLVIDRFNEDRMNEDNDSDDLSDDGDDDSDDYGSDGEDYDYDDADDDYDEEDEDTTAVCQCHTCRRDRDSKLELERKKLELEALERAKQEKLKRQLILRTPGTMSVSFHKVPLARPEKEYSDGKYILKKMYMDTITAMDGYNTKSLEELRFEDYCNDNPSLRDVKKRLDAEILDRIKEATNRIAMDKEDKSMRIWSKAADKAWKKYLIALSRYNSHVAEEKDEIAELFSDALSTCLSGPHSVDSYYCRACCYYPKHLDKVIADCTSLLELKPKHLNANYLLGSVLLKCGQDYLKAEKHLLIAYSLDERLFTSDVNKNYELVRAQFMASMQQFINEAEEKKLNGNKEMTKGNFSEAEKFYSEAIALSPFGDNSHVYYSNRATARCELSMKLLKSPEAKELLKAAISDCDTCLLLYRNYPKALFRKYLSQGLLYFYDDIFGPALENFNRAIELDPSNTMVKQELKRVGTSIEIIRAKEKASEIEREVAARELLRAEEREKERKLLAEKKARDEQIRKEKTEKLEREKAEKLRIKAEKEKLKSEKDSSAAEGKLKDKEVLKAEKEREKALKEQQKIEEREKKRQEKEREKERLRLEKEKHEQEQKELQEKELQRKLQFEEEMNRVKAVLQASKAHPVTSSTTPDILPSTKTKTNKEESVTDTVDTTKTVSSPEKSEKITAVNMKKEKEKSPEKAEIPRETVVAPVVEVITPPLEEVKPALEPVKKKLVNPLSSIAAIAKSISASTPSTKPISSITTNAPPRPQPAPVASTVVVTRFMDCPQSKVKLVIGAKGSIINEMMRRTGCKMCINQDYPDGQPRKCQFVGTQDQIEEAKVLVAAVIVHGPNVLSSPELINEVGIHVKNGNFNPMASSWSFVKSTESPSPPVVIPEPELKKTMSSTNISVANTVNTTEQSSLLACDDDVCPLKGKQMFKSIFELQAHKRNHQVVETFSNLEKTSTLREEPINTHETIETNFQNQLFGDSLFTSIPGISTDSSIATNVNSNSGGYGSLYDMGNSFNSIPGIDHNKAFDLGNILSSISAPSNVNMNQGSSFNVDNGLPSYLDNSLTKTNSSPFYGNSNDFPLSNSSSLYGSTFAPPLQSQMNDLNGSSLQNMNDMSNWMNMNNSLSKNLDNGHNRHGLPGLGQSNVGSVNDFDFNLPLSQNSLGGNLWGGLNDLVSGTNTLGGSHSNDLFSSNSNLNMDVNMYGNRSSILSPSMFEFNSSNGLSLDSLSLSGSQPYGNMNNPLNNTTNSSFLSSGVPFTNNIVKDIIPILDEDHNNIWDDDDENDHTITQSYNEDRSLLPKDLMPKLLDVLKAHPGGILGSQFPEAYRKLFGEKLVLETIKGKKLKLLHVLDGHPNVRKEKSGTWKWFYKSDSSNDNYVANAGIEVDILTDNTFPSVVWLREFDINMYRWAGNSTEWTEYAMRLSPEIEHIFEGENDPTVISQRTNCNVTIQSEKLHGQNANFLVFVRGLSGHISNSYMTNALNIVSDLIKMEFLTNGLLTMDESHNENEHNLRLLSAPISSDRVQRVLDIPQSSVGLIAGKMGKKLFAMRKKSGAYMALVSKSKNTNPAKLTISGTPESVDIALNLVHNALSEKDNSI